MGSRASADVGEEPASRSELRSAALEALEQPLERRPTPFSYRLSLALVALLVVALPLVYVSLVGGVGWGVYWYATHGAELFAEMEGGRGYVLVRFGPLVVGAVLFLFLLKPIVARPERREPPFSLEPDAQPFLFEFVRELSRRLGAPMPRRIDADLAVNASASFAGGLGSVLGGELVLTMGLPLVSGMSLRELTAVLAHEFGHLSQGAGMRSYYLVQRVNHWFARVVFARDRWDRRLELWSKNGVWITNLVMNVARACVWSSRQVLFVLMKIAAAASSHMSRQMEFDADRNAIRLCGTRAFVRSMELLPQIGAATEWAVALNGLAIRSGRLADDYPSLVREGMDHLRPEARRALIQESMESQVKMYATHPPTGERVARAEKLASDGVFAVPGPASLLFRDYAGLCRELTRRQYEGELGDELGSLEVVPSASVQSAHEELEHLGEQIRTFFAGAPIGPTSLALPPPSPEPPESQPEALERLESVRRELARAGRENAARPDSGAEQRRARASAAKELLACGVEVRDEAFAERSEENAEHAIAEALGELERERTSRAPLAALMRDRIVQTLDLACQDSVRSRVPEGDALFARGLRAASLVAELPAVSNEIHELSLRFTVLPALLPQLEGQGEHAVDRVLGAQALALSQRLVGVREAAAGRLYPFEHGREGVTLADYLVEAVPPAPRHFQLQAEAAQKTLGAWSLLIQRLYGEVACLGLAVEAALELEPVRIEAGDE